MNRFHPISETIINNSVEETLGKMISDHFSLSLNRQKQKNLGVILTNFMDFGDYMNIAIALKKENVNMNEILQTVGKILSKTDLSEIEKEIEDFVGEEEFHVYRDIIRKLLTRHSSKIVKNN